MPHSVVRLSPALLICSCKIKNPAHDPGVGVTTSGMTGRQGENTIPSRLHAFPLWKPQPRPPTLRCLGKNNSATFFSNCAVAGVLSCKPAAFWASARDLLAASKNRPSSGRLRPRPPDNGPNHCYPDAPCQCQYGLGHAYPFRTDREFRPSMPTRVSNFCAGVWRFFLVGPQEIWWQRVSEARVIADLMGWPSDHLCSACPFPRAITMTSSTSITIARRARRRALSTASELGV